MSWKSFLILQAIKTIGMIPIGLRSRIGYVLGLIVSLFSSRNKRVADLQLDLHLAEAGGRKITPWVYASIGQSFMESCNLEPLLSDPSRIVWEDEGTALPEFKNADRPTIALTAHTSNWELLAAYFSRRGIGIATIGREARRDYLKPALEALRARHRIDVIWRSDLGGTRQVLEQLSRGKVLAALIDQDTHVNNIFVPFFGRPASTPSSLARLALKRGARVVVPLIFRTAVGRYKIEVTDISECRTVEEMLTRYSEILEAGIRRHPEQWVWFHKRWRTTPDEGVLPSLRYVQYLERIKSGSANT
jgi:Kdo2-lipid IVA lauroyltransferase/acyltransferase